SPKIEALAAGSDSLPAVVPATENLRPPFRPTTDQSWLTMTGVTSGVVSFSFTQNTGTIRTGHVMLLGENIPVNQYGPIGAATLLTGATFLANGTFQFSFTNYPGASFTV